MNKCNWRARSLLCLAGLLLITTWPTAARADLSSDQAEQRATKAAAILKSLGIAPNRPKFREGDQAASHWVVMAGDNVAPVGKAVFGALVYVYLRAQDAKQDFDYSARPQDAADGPWQQFLTTCDGSGVVGYGKSGVGPICFMRCGNVTLHLGWCKGRPQGVPEDAAYRQEAYGALKQMVAQIHETFRAQGVCGSGAVPAPASQPAATPAGPTPDTHATSTPPKPPATTAPTTPPQFPANERPEVEPWVQLTLGTARYLPDEPLVYVATVSSGVPEASNTKVGELTLSVSRNSAAVEAFLIFALAGLGASAEPPSLAFPTLSEDRAAINKPVLSGPLCGAIRAPGEPGEYRLIASFVTADGRRAKALVPFDVMKQVKRLVIHAPYTVSAGENGIAHISVPFEVDGIPEKREPPTVKAWGEVQSATKDAIVAGRGFQLLASLDDHEVTPRMWEKGKAEDKIEWNIKCPQTGFYRVSFTLTAPYYGTREGQTFVVYLPRNGPGGRPAVAPNTAGGDGGRATAGGATVTTVGTATAPSTTAGAPTGSQPAAGPDSILIKSFGFTLGMQNGGIVITGVTPGSFAAEVDIKAGWRLNEADNHNARGMSLAQLKALLAPADKHTIILYFLTPEGKDAIVDLHPDQE